MFTLSSLWAGFRNQREETGCHFSNQLLPFTPYQQCEQHEYSEYLGRFGYLEYLGYSYRLPCLSSNGSHILPNTKALLFLMYKRLGSGQCGRLFSASYMVWPIIHALLDLISFGVFSILLQSSRSYQLSAPALAILPWISTSKASTWIDVPQLFHHYRGGARFWLLCTFPRGTRGFTQLLC